MNLHTLTQVQDLPMSVAEAWAFFSAPANLQAITPPDIRFEFLGDHSGPMYESRILRYRIGIALKAVSVPVLLWLAWRLGQPQVRAQYRHRR